MQFDRRPAASLCISCRENFAFQLGVPLQAFIDSLPVPIFVVDDDVKVKAVNREGRALIGKGAQEILERLGGVVFDCAYAQLPEGCGKTVHCSGCAIRRSVRHTWLTGEPLVDVPATLNCSRAEEEKVALHISTDRMGDIVVLRVESAAPSTAA
jgi:PAS domain-containing protein